jgi:NTE family protein
MKKIIPNICIIILSLIYNQDRPTIALVLSGGGAKGLSQIPTLALIDSLNIPIDYIVGTSMGSISGSMYAMGYSPEEIQKIAFEADWDMIFSNNKNRKELYFFQKRDYDKYKVVFRLDGITPIAPIALTNGHSSYMHLSKLSGINEIKNNFNDFLIPFRCNAVDLLSGNEIIFSKGSLAKALRASSSIPSIFSPIKDNKLLLADGGIINNFPIDIASQLGADMIIGVNVSFNKKHTDDIRTVFDVLSQSILLNGFKKRIDNLYHTDILIEPDVSNESMLNFSKETMNQFYIKGRNAAYSKLDQLVKLKESLNIDIPIYTTLSSIKTNIFTINDIVITSNSNVTSINQFKKTSLPLKLTKNEFLDKLSKIRSSYKYINIHYQLLKNNNAYTLILSLDAVSKNFIDKVTIIGNDKLSTLFIKDILNIKSGDLLDINLIRDNINQAYNLDYFESIRYELEKNEDRVDINFIIQESTYNKLKLSGTWNNYYKLIGNIKLDLITNPFDKFRLTNEVNIGSLLKENLINLYYINNFKYDVNFIPILKFRTIKKEISYYNQDNIIEKQQAYNYDYSINTIIPLNKYGHIDIGLHKQRIDYEKAFFNREKSNYYSVDIDIDQIDNLLYPKNGYHYNISLNKSNDSYNYYINNISFDHFVKFNEISRIKFYGDLMFSNLEEFNDDQLIYKSIYYLPYDRTLSFSEYNLFITDLKTYGVEFNIDYKNSTTIRLLYNYIDHAQFKHNGNILSNYSSLGFGFRVASILGPLNFMWTHTENELYNQGHNNYFFSLGIDY